MRLDREHMTREALELAEASRSVWSPCRGGEAVESARPGEALQSMNLRILEVEGGLLRRLDDFASSKAFYTFYTSTRPDKHAHVCQPFLARSTEIPEIAEPFVSIGVKNNKREE